MKWPLVTMQCLFILFFLQRDYITGNHDVIKITSIMKINFKLHLNCRNTNMNGVLYRWHTIFERKKKSPCTYYFKSTPIWKCSFVHPNVDDDDLMAYFIASKCFAAKTGFPNRWLDVAQSGFSKCPVLFWFGEYREPLICLISHNNFIILMYRNEFAFILLMD